MDEQIHEWGKVKWLWLAALVLSEAVGLIVGARHGGLWMAVMLGGGVVVLFALVFGAYYLWRRSRARNRRQVFSAAIQAQSTIAPRSVHDPNQRAALDRLRQKFQAGLNEFTSRGRDIYKLPWYLIIGEPGSGKTEAIRHSGIDFPPGLQNELQGSGGTVNMDWWFTNHGVMLDTAGRLLFSETPAGQSPEWTEFLKLLKKARSHCPVNGLFIVLSVESLIRDSAEKIAQKASRMAQQLDLIQRTLDVR
ncbi:MAG: type VI secretion protein IcmF/TssM N-terminal domain-containing protein, partial [Limisphaerales bacterium]